MAPNEPYEYDLMHMNMTATFSQKFLAALDANCG
jgi:hypothetical protein